MVDLDDFYNLDESKLDKARRKVNSLLRRYRYKVKNSMDVITGKHLKDSPLYEGIPRTGQEQVEMEPERWIIPECIPACKILWSKNIYTFMCSDRVDDNAWIEIDLDNLSLENKAIMEEIKNEYSCVPYHPGCLYFSVKGMGYKAAQELIKIAERFVMQDVPDKEACISLEDALIEVGCFKEVPNPRYVSPDDYFLMHPEIPVEDRFMVLYENNIDFFNPTIRVLDPEKIKEPVEANFIGSQFVFDHDSEKIYFSSFHYQKHLNYLKYLTNEERKNKSIS